MIIRSRLRAHLRYKAYGQKNKTTQQLRGLIWSWAVAWKPTLLLQHPGLFQKALDAFNRPTYFLIVDAVVDVLSIPLCIYKPGKAEDAEVL